MQSLPSSKPSRIGTRSSKRRCMENLGLTRPDCNFTVIKRNNCDTFCATDTTGLHGQLSFAMSAVLQIRHRWNVFSSPALAELPPHTHNGSGIELRGCARVCRKERGRTKRNHRRAAFQISEDTQRPTTASTNPSATKTLNLQDVGMQGLRQDLKKLKEDVKKLKTEIELAETPRWNPSTNSPQFSNTRRVHDQVPTALASCGRESVSLCSCWSVTLYDIGK